MQNQKQAPTQRCGENQESRHSGQMFTKNHQNTPKVHQKSQKESPKLSVFIEKHNKYSKRTPNAKNCPVNTPFLRRGLKNLGKAAATRHLMALAENSSNLAGQIIAIDEADLCLSPYF